MHSFYCATESQYEVAIKTKSTRQNFSVDRNPTITTFTYPQTQGSTDAARSGVGWSSHLSGSEPGWVREPDIQVLERIASRILKYPCKVSTFAQGSFNKVYDVQRKEEERNQDDNVAPQKLYLMRVSLPVDSKYKSLSEVATLAWIKQHTTIPVPTVLAFNSDCTADDDELGFEWMLMEKMPGKPLEQAWKSMTWSRKEDLVVRIAHSCAELYSKRFPAIGCLYFAGQYPATNCDFTKLQSNESTKYVMGRYISMKFFWENHCRYHTPCGPFVSSVDWLRASLRLDQLDCDDILANSTDKEAVDGAMISQATVKRLLGSLNVIFADEDFSNPSTVLLHPDMSRGNILVDENGRLQAIIDWECTSAVPLWEAAQYPEFLYQGPDLDIEPQEEDFIMKKDKSGEEDDEVESNDMFDDLLLRYETTQLKKIFITTMEKACPEWVRFFRESTVKADFFRAVHQCGPQKIAHKPINMWLDGLGKGQRDLASWENYFHPEVE